MENGTIYTLIPLADFKAILGIDDREDVLSRYCLVTATCTIEQYCMRRLILKKHFEHIEFHSDLILPLGEYPVREVLGVWGVKGGGWGGEEFFEPELYRVIPDLEAETGERPEGEMNNEQGTINSERLRGEGLNMPYMLCLSPALNRGQGLCAVKAVYMAGYGYGEAPADLASACLELAAWNMTRYKGRRIGMTGNIRGSGKDGEHLEASMPENVRLLLEPYRRRVI
jgi:hypothetical protein